MSRCGASLHAPRLVHLMTGLRVIDDGPVMDAEVDRASTGMLGKMGHDDAPRPLIVARCLERTLESLTNGSLKHENPLSREGRLTFLACITIGKGCRCGIPRYGFYFYRYPIKLNFGISSFPIGVARFCLTSSG